MKLIQYSSNNSGGDWWLTDEDWYKLEEAGWDVEWYKDKTEESSYYKNGRFLGALATYASKEFESIEAATEEWEMITGQDSNEIGCPCCGEPHSFYEIK